MAISLALHALVFTLAFTQLSVLTDKSNPSAHEQKVTVLVIRPPESEKSAPEPAPAAHMVEASALPLPPTPAPEVPAVVEGPDHGMVRFRVETALDGSLT